MPSDDGLGSVRRCRGWPGENLDVFRLRLGAPSRPRPARTAASRTTQRVQANQTGSLVCNGFCKAGPPWPEPCLSVDVRTGG